MRIQHEIGTGEEDKYKRSGEVVLAAATASLLPSKSFGCYLPPFRGITHKSNKCWVIPFSSDSGTHVASVLSPKQGALATGQA